MIADQCEPCTPDFYKGIYQGVLIALNAEDGKPTWQEIVKEAEDFAFTRALDPIDTVRCFEQCAKFIARNK